MSELITKSVQTMSSREIAELTGKEHAHVMRDIRTMLDVLKKDASSFGGIYRDSYGREKPCFNLDRELTMTLVSGYDIPLRHRVVTRLAELEAQAAKPVHLVPQSLPEALRLAADLAEQKAKSDAALAIAAPKAEALDRIATADGSSCITDAAKVLQIRPKDLFKWLQAHQWIYRRQGGAGWLAYQQRIQQGYLEHKVTTVERSDGTEKVIEAVRVTRKGLARLAQAFGDSSEGNLLAA